MKTRIVATAVSLLLAVSVTACGGGSSSAVTVTGAWVRAAPAGTQSAAYFSLANTSSGDDALTGVSTPAAMMANLHETSTDSSGMTGMHPVESISIPAGKTVKLEPGGYHVMLMSLAGELAAGGTVELTLTFRQAGTVKVTAEVRGS